ncbi:hypothetical protein IKE13_02260 [Candidatus Saccharibacteria bacterium]|nr:hypothetical protein [Candidatus Saccharibacteria bacterium]
MTKINRKNKNKRKITVYNSVSILGSILGDPFYYGILVQGGQKVDLREILPDFKPMITEEEFGLIQAKQMEETSKAYIQQCFDRRISVWCT